MRGKFLWTFPVHRMQAVASVFPPEWVVSRAEIMPPLVALRDSDIWLVAEKNGRAFLHGHLRVAKIAQCVDDLRDDSILLVADRAASFRVSRTCAPRWKMKAREIQPKIAEIDADTVGEISDLTAANSKFALARRRVRIAIPADVWLSGNSAAIAAEAYAHALRSVELSGAFRLASDKALTPFGAAVLSSMPENLRMSGPVEKAVRMLDAEVNRTLCAAKPPALRRPEKPRQRNSGASPMVDTVLLPLDPARITARVFLKSNADFERSVPEKTSSAEARHQEILRQSAKKLAALGFPPLRSESVDLAVRAGARLRLFEIKSATKGNFQSQARRGLIQALEYQAAFEKCGHADVRAALIIDNAGTAAEKRYFKEFGARIGVVVFYHDNQNPLSEVGTFLGAKEA